MNTPRVLYQMVRADFLERVRRYSFLLTLAFAVYMGYGAFSGKIILSLGDYRGVYNSAWLGALMGSISSIFLSLTGFYVVKGSIQRDQQTRVGQVLAATPMSKSFYTAAKSISNFAVLASMVLVMGACAVLMQLLRGEDPHIHLWTLLAPLLLVALPALAFVAALAVLFDSIPILRGGVGNVVFFFLWIALLAGSGPGSFDHGSTRSRVQYFADFTGIISQMDDMRTDLRRVASDYKGGSALNIGDKVPTKRFVWLGVHWTPPMYESRLFWLLAASFVAWLASFPFHRFDPAREWRLGRRPTSPESAASFTSTDQVLQPAHVAHFPARLSSLAREGKTNTNRSPFVRLVLAELRLMLKGQRWWWYVTALGLAIACLVSPLPASRGGVLLAAWLWPLLLWSAMGSRESRFSTQSLVFSSARSLPRQLPAVWFAGVLVAVLTGGGVAVRLLLGGNGSGLGAWIARALFIPSLALALGVWSGGSKMFEAIYTVWWYVGPAHHTPGLDFMGVSAASSRPLLYLTLTAVLLIASYWGRRSRLGYA